MFSKFAKMFSNILGDSKAFFSAVVVILIWSVLGFYYAFSDSWQLLINTVTTIITFLMVFLIQNTQNRDTLAVQLKLDEVIRALKGAHNELVDIEKLTDVELEKIHKRYEELAKKAKRDIKQGKKDTGTPRIKNKSR